MQAHTSGELGVLGTVLLRVYSGTTFAIFIEIGLYLTDKEQKICWHSFLRHGVVTRLHASQHCFIVLYADDILIYAPSIRELQTIVNTCELELQSIDMAINVKKSCTMRIGPRHDIKCSNITINN